MTTDHEPQQLSLGVSLHDEATFDNFYLPANSPSRQLVAALQSQLSAAGEQAIYIWGAPGAGLTHLLQACCHHAQAQGYHAQYLPLQDLAGFAPQSLLEGMTSQHLVCLDSLESVVGNPQWDQALFNFFNQMRDAGKAMVFAATCGPGELACSLEDLRSRLAWSVTYQVAVLSDEEKQRALQSRAKARGIAMSDEVAQFILTRAPRDMNDLFYLLNRLDAASLEQQRKLTIPFIKKVLNL